MSRLGFQIEATAPGTRARAASFRTLHGEVRTPIFMPVGTQATVKSQTVESLLVSGSRILLANTYHLMLRPGPEVFKKFGGIHRLMNWSGPVLTDSGGFQIFSLPHSRRINEDGAVFQSYVDGKTHLLSPETSIQMQRAIGSDIMMVLDQCIPSTAEKTDAIAAMELTHRWAKRSLTARGDSDQALFGIVQGACFEDLRKQSAEALCALPFDGFAIGGLAVGETKAQREDFTEWTASLLPPELPRYLMGVGTPLDILEAVHRGVDMFDCILPSSLAQRGVAFTSQGKLQLRRGVYKLSEERLDPDCSCSTCAHYSRAYLHHLYKAEEPLGWTLLTSHNLTFYHCMMAEMRAAILSGAFREYYASKRAELERTDEEHPVTPPRKSRIKASVRLELGDYRVHRSEKGHTSIAQISSGEIMHSVNEPSEEANRLYIEQSDLKAKLQTEGAPLVIWDVGLGIAANAMAAVRCFTPQARSLRILSFERDLDPLRLALKHSARFPHLHHSAPHALVRDGEWSNESNDLTWKLISGDFLELFNRAERPDLVFYDPFSLKTNPELWSPAVFGNLHRHFAGGPTEIFTYSSSTAVRAALLSAGFFVAKGASTGIVPDTTWALNREALETSAAKNQLLGSRWLQTWQRSRAQFPSSVPDDAKPGFERVILDHPQFISGSWPFSPAQS